MSRAEEMGALAVLLAAPTLLWPLLQLWNKQAQPDEPPEKSTTDSVGRNIHEKLQSQLLDLSIQGYEQLIAQVLRAVGYENVRVLRDPNSKRRSHKGRNRHGGYDITALVKTEFNTQPVLIQVKQYERPISRRFVDELRGALLRTQARQGVLITTSTFALRARQAASEDHIGPVHLVDGGDLRELLLNYRIGVGENRRGKPYLKKRFFRRLEEFLPIVPKVTWEQV